MIRRPDPNRLKRRRQPPFTEDELNEIKTNPDNLNDKQLALKFNRSPQVIANIRRGKTYNKPTINSRINHTKSKGKRK
jgi:hypothetical protein